MTALAECNAALTDLQGSSCYKQYAKNGTLAKTKLGSSERHLKAAIDQLSPSPPPPSNVVALHDLRATSVTSIPYNGRHGPAATGAALSFTAPNDLDHMKAIFQCGDITLDGGWFNVHIHQNSTREASSHNPWGMQETPTEWLQIPNSAELTFQRTHIEGEVLWYRQDFLVPMDFTAPTRDQGWSLGTQFCYPSIISPPAGLEINGDGFGFDRDYGTVSTLSAINSFQKVRMQVPRLTLAAIKGKKLRTLVGAKWTVAQDGWIVLKTSLEGEVGWTVDYQATGQTYQLVQSQGLLTGVDEKQGGYIGWFKGAASTGFSTNWKFSGLTIHATEQDALAA